MRDEWETRGLCHSGKTSAKGARMKTRWVFKARPKRKVTEAMDAWERGDRREDYRKQSGMWVLASENREVRLSCHSVDSKTKNK